MFLRQSPMDAPSHCTRRPSNPLVAEDCTVPFPLYPAARAPRQPLPTCPRDSERATACWRHLIGPCFSWQDPVRSLGQEDLLIIPCTIIPPSYQDIILIVPLVPYLQVSMFLPINHRKGQRPFKSVSSNCFYFGKRRFLAIIRLEHFSTTAV